MFPKLASGILRGDVSRAALSQTQNSQFRTVLQFSPSYPPSPLPPATPLQPNSLLVNTHGAASGSSDGGSRAGGSRNNKFSEGYPGLRAATQANAFLTSYDAPAIIGEETEELDLGPRSNDTVSALFIARTLQDREPRLRRRNSMALGFIGPTVKERAQSFGIVSAVKKHVRQQHAFAAPIRPSPLSSQQSQSLATQEKRHAAASHPADKRSESSLANGYPSLAHGVIDLPPSLLRPPDLEADVHSKRAAADLAAQKAWEEALHTARIAKDKDTVHQMARAFLDESARTHPDEAQYNLLLRALAETRSIGDPIVLSLELYNNLIARGIVPTVRIYQRIISLLCYRDDEVHRAIAELEESLETKYLTSPTSVSVRADKSKIAQLRSENNFQSALQLFYAATSGLHLKFSTRLCNLLLASCSHYKNVDAAERIFGHLEHQTEWERAPDTSSYAKLIRAYESVNDVANAREVFQRYRDASKDRKAMKLGDVSATAPFHAMMSAFFRGGMPEEAVALLEEMMASADSNRNGMPPTAPSPNPGTYSTIIKGFCEAGDVSSACKWFDQLLAAEQAAVSDESANEESDDDGLSESSLQSISSFAPLPPTRQAWTDLLHALHKANDIHAFARYYRLLEVRSMKDRIHEWPLPYLSLFADLTKRTVESLASSEPQVEALLESLVSSLRTPAAFSRPTVRPAVLQVFDVLASNGRFALGMKTVKDLVDRMNDPMLADTTQVRHIRQWLPSILKSIQRAVLLAHPDELSVRKLLDLANLATSFGIPTVPEFMVPAFVTAYSREGLLAVRDAVSDHGEWLLLTQVFAQHYRSRKPDDRVSRQYQSFVTGLGELVARNTFTHAVKDQMAVLVGERLAENGGIFSEEETVAMLAPFGAATLAQYTSTTVGSGSDFDSSPEHTGPSSVIPSPDSASFAPLPQSPIRVGESITRFLDDFCLPEYKGITPIESYNRYISSIQNGLHPAPATTAQYLTILSKHSLYEQAKHVYASSQPLLEAIAYDKPWQAQSWFQIEDGMMQAAAIAGDVVTSNVHRQRIIEQGGAPSAASYAALIIASKTMTDDATVASNLFSESQSLGVKAHTYLYNVVISALSRARRADEALALFAKMKEEGVRWSSVTYGALIGACTRIGDEQTAKYLFEEMLVQPGMKPRVPPFNTMIQMYVQIKPDREQALLYYQKMLSRRIRPTAHTYKLLMDCYGTIEPINLVEMEKVFRQLEHDHSVQVGGPHFASLINAYGCVAKDLDRAIAIFESIANKPYPSTWEAMVRAELGAGERERAQNLFRRMEARFYPELVLQRVRALVYPLEDYAGIVA
ncbi:hypothetical protein FRC00_010614 [Tulasnella sp. 408]|nr:hypothetical protein FRC00_010614 [Tulasnella sp. 408]